MPGMVAHCQAQDKDCGLHWPLILPTPFQKHTVRCSSVDPLLFHIPFFKSLMGLGLLAKGLGRIQQISKLQQCSNSPIQQTI